MSIFIANTSYEVSLGVIDIPFEPLEETKAIVDSATTNFSKAELIKLDNFIISLKSYGLWEKIRIIITPSFFHSSDDIFLNLKDAVRLTGSTDKINFTDGLGINFRSYLETDAAPNLDISSYAIKNSNSHIGFYNTTPDNTSAGNSVAACIKDVKSAIMLNAIGRRALSSNGAVYLDTTRLDFDAATLLSTGFCIASFNYPSQTIIANADGNPYEYNGVFPPVSSISQIVKNLVFNYSNNYNSGFAPPKGDYGLFTIGVDLSADELAIYNTIISGFL